MKKIILLVLLSSLAVFAAGCGKKEAEKPPEKFVNVTVATVQKMNLAVVESAVGSATSLSAAQALNPNSVKRSTLSIRLPFPEHIARQLHIGQKVDLTSFDDANKKATAYITEIRPSLNNTTQTLEVIAELRGGQEWYSVGSVRGEVTIGTHQGALVVPEQAVILRPAGNVVYVPDGETAKERPVKTGIARNGQIEILDGLKAGETVAVDGAALLSDGAKIKVREASAKPTGSEAPVKAKP